jgi:hypothetical protein
MDLQGFDAQGQQLGQQVGGAVLVVLGLNQPQGADRQAAAAAVAAGLNHLPVDGIGGADALAGAIALRRAEGRVEAGLAEVGILAVVEADHQPGAGPTGEAAGGSETLQGDRHHRRVCGHIDAIGFGQSVGQSQTADTAQVLIAGAADQLEPVTALQGSRWRGIDHRRSGGTRPPESVGSGVPSGSCGHRPSRSRP